MRAGCMAATTRFAGGCLEVKTGDGDKEVDQPFGLSRLPGVEAKKR